MSIAHNEPLTARESRVLELLRSGLSNKQIARAVGISEQTVKFHLKNLYCKLGAQGRAHAVALAGAPRDEARAVPALGAEEARAGMEPVQSPLTLARRTRRLYPDREAVVDGERRFTWAQFFERCDRASSVLLGLGVTRGDRVATVAPNTHAHLEQFYAVPQIGAVIVPIHARLNTEGLQTLIRHSGAKVVCVSREYLAAIDSIRAQLPEVSHFVALDAPAVPGWLDYEALLETADPAPPQEPIGDHDPIAINYTSGTTHHPRGAVLTHRNLWLNAIGVQLHWTLHCQDRYLWTLPLFHCNGWGFAWAVTAGGATHVCVRDSSAEALCALAARERVTALSAGKAALIAMVNLPESLRRTLPSGVRVLTAGATPAADTLERMESDLGWQVTHAYGLSETSPFLTVCELTPEERAQPLSRRVRLQLRQGTELLTSGELRVVDEEGQDVPHDGCTLGEIVVRGGVVMRGYFRDAEASARAFAGGWFHTGDAAVMHADGSVEIRDRFKDIIISGDEMLSSIEIEDVLLDHPAVREAAVLGVPHAELGESAHAFVVLRPGMQASEAELRAFVASRLPPFKVPTAFQCVQQLPRTPTGKVRKQDLRALCA